MYIGIPERDFEARDNPEAVIHKDQSHHTCSEKKKIQSRVRVTTLDMYMYRHMYIEPRYHIRN